MKLTVEGSRVLITGAASGMGFLYAQRAVAEGAAVVWLWDIDKRALAKAVKSLSPAAVPRTILRSDVVDLRRRKAIEEAADKVIRKIGGVDVLINNAGVVRGAFFWEHDNARHTETTMKVNALAPMYATHEFLPLMMTNDRQSRIVNIASAAGLLSNPKMSVYASSKWALIGWSDSLRLELKREGYSQVAVTTVAPSYISTGMFEGVRGPLMTPIMKPDYVVNRVWKAMIAGKPMLMLPWSVHLSKLLKGLLPQRAFDWIAANIFHVYDSMDEFVGRR
jgi:NAD(P)-dependent dehydrogenase (short-subunit alcohol dehydrogenase family)